MTKKLTKEQAKPYSNIKIDLDLDIAKKLAYLQCTEAEIASVLGCSPRTLRRSKEFMAIYTEGREHGKSSLRRLQWEKARGIEAVLAKDESGDILKDEKGRAIVLTPGSAPDTVMQIWLGKQYLEQKDKREELHGGVIGIKVISGVPRPNKESIRNISPQPELLPAP
jgi:hypothetical protein